MQTINEFIKKHGLTMEFQPTPTNPNWIEIGEPEKKNPTVGFAHYYITITKNGAFPNKNAEYHCYYSMGHKVFPHSEIDTAMERRKRKPTLPDVLDCLSSDASFVEESGNFVEWALDLGYEIKSYAIYHQIMSSYNASLGQSLKLKELLGQEAYAELLYETEKL